MTNKAKINKSRNKGRSKGRNQAQDRRRLRKLEKQQIEVPGEKMLGRVARRGYGGGVVAEDGSNVPEKGVY